MKVISFELTRSEPSILTRTCVRDCEWREASVSLVLFIVIETHVFKRNGFASLFQKRYRRLYKVAINTYRQCECLWNVKSKDYSHKNRRNECYDKLLAVLKTTDQDANKETVVKKINIRASYRKERKKTRESRSGSGAAQVYNTKLWYFKFLDFLDDSSPILPTRDNLNETQDSSTQDSSNTETNYSDVVSPASDIISSQPSTSSNCKRRADTLAADDLLDTLNNQLNSDLFNVREDEYDAVGKNIAAKLRKLPETTRILTEKLLNDVMFAAQMNTITMDTAIYTPQGGYTTYNNDNV